MNQKGFTLIELLAVILVLGIIALIAIPVVNKVIDQARRGSFRATVDNVVKAVEDECQLKRLRGEELVTTYTFTDGVATPTINVKGKLPQSGTISVNNNCETLVNVTDDKYSATKSLASAEIIVGKIGGDETEIEDEPEKNITLTTDNNNNGEADIGDIITVKSLENTNEEFYVISNDGTNIVALAKYNLKVGRIYTDGSTYTQIVSTEEGYGLQNAEMIGGPPDIGYPIKGTTATDYSGSMLRQYVNEYRNKLPNEVIDARLITKGEIEQLVNGGSSLSEEYIDSKANELGRQWIYSTTYWSDSASSIYYVWIVYSDGYFRDITVSTADYCGVRPVITILESEL